MRRARSGATGGSRAVLLLILVAVLAGTVVLSLRLGAAELAMRDVLGALFAYNDSSYEQNVVSTLRLPRTVLGMAAGAALAVAGAAMQAVTRNPLASPAILSVNAGAAFGVVTAVSIFGLTGPSSYLWFSFAGGAVAALLVYVIGSQGAGGASPAKLALAGVIVASLLSSWTTAVLLFDQQSLDVVRFWLVGSLAGRSTHVLSIAAPFQTVMVLLLVLSGSQLNVISMGDERARSLGMNTGRVRGAVLAMVVVAAGATVAATGPIGFVGLAVPHMVRSFTGPDYRAITVGSLLVGPIVLLGADILGRVAFRPTEIQVGVVTALIGAPFLIGLARRRGAISL